MWLASGLRIGTRTAGVVLMCLIASAALSACDGGQQPEATAVLEQRPTVIVETAADPTLGLTPTLALKPTAASTPTSTPMLTPTPTALPTPLPTATPTPRSTAIPTPAPQPTATRTPDPAPEWPQTVDELIVWRIGNDISPQIEAEARSVALAMHNYLVSLDFPPIARQVTIFLFHDLDSLAVEFKATTGKGLAEGGAGPAFAEGRRVIVSTGNWIALNTSADRYQEYSSGTRKRILGANLFNVYQRAVSGLSLAPSYHEVPSAGPYWLSRGAADYVTFEALEASDPESCDATRSRFAYLSEPVYTPINEAETPAGYNSMRHSRQYAFLAAELLASQAGEGALGAYFASLWHGTSWEEAFQTAFGTKVEEFHQLFEEHRAAGFPNPDAPSPSATLPGAPDYVKWHIGPNVPSGDVEPFVKGARLMHEYITSLGLPEIGQDIKFHLFHNVHDLAPVYYAARGLKPRCSREWWFSQGRATSVGPAGIFMTTYDRDHDSLTKITVHELINAYQYGLSKLPVSGGASDEVPKGGPRWLTEGVAEYLANRAVSAGGVLDYAAERNSIHPRGWVERVKLIDKPLSEMETQIGFSGVGNSKYKYALLAAELLAFRAGEAELVYYYTLTQPGTNWQETFQAAFGMTVAEFYDLFEEHREAGFPEPEASK